MVKSRPPGLFSPNSAQLVAARAALGLSVAELAKKTGLGVNTVRRSEAAGAHVLTAANAARLVEVLEGLGVTFLEADERGPGLRVRPPS